MRGPLWRLIRAALPAADYLALYPGKIVKQNGNKVDVQLDAGDRIASPSGIPLRLGIPGATAKVSPGARCLVGWDNGDPRYPFAALWDAGATTLELTVEANKVTLSGTEQITIQGGLVKLSDTASLAVARVSDMAGPYPITGGNGKVLA